MDTGKARCKRALVKFDAEILKCFSTDDIEQGGYITEDRKGEMEFHRLNAPSIGAIEIKPGMFRNHILLSIAAAKVKKRAKAIPGKSQFINQRLNTSEADTAW